MLGVALTLNPLNQGCVAGTCAAYIAAFWLAAVSIDFVFAVCNAVFRCLVLNNGYSAITAAPFIEQVLIKRQWQPYTAKYP